jgi:hypothetical protein
VPRLSVSRKGSAKSLFCFQSKLISVENFGLRSSGTMDTALSLSLSRPSPHRGMDSKTQKLPRLNLITWRNNGGISKPAKSPTVINAANIRAYPIGVVTASERSNEGRVEREKILVGSECPRAACSLKSTRFIG